MVDGYIVIPGIKRNDILPESVKKRRRMSLKNMKEIMQKQRKKGSHNICIEERNPGTENPCRG